MIKNNIYRDRKDHTWYESTNVIYSKCYDNAGLNKPVKIVFKNGRTYMYKDVDMNDYMNFKNSPSTGDGFSKFIKKYKATRIQDTDLEKLEEMRQSMLAATEEIAETKVNDLAYEIEYDPNNGQFALKLGGKTYFSGVEQQVSIFSLFNSIKIPYVVKESEGLDINGDIDKDLIDTND